MSEANLNVNLPSSESDDDMTSTGITEKELVAIENEVIPEATRRSTKYGMKKIVDWFTDKKIDIIDCGQISATELNGHLRGFYGELNHGKKGKSLSPSTLNAIRASIQRTISAAPYQIGGGGGVGQA